MRLKRLELHGFKSFASRASLEFEPGISALVGPNGSGKSNVADAVRWVLGEQSARALRGRRPEEMIFAGSAQRHSLGMAEVALVLDNSVRRLSLDYAEVRIARRLYRSGESEYLINGSRVRRKDLVGLMLEVGLHSEGYTVIGQGAVEALVLQRPDERRAMLEHAGDISRHQARLSEARAKLAATEQNLIRCEDVLSELEPHARRLRQQAERAAAYATRRAELAALAGSYFRAALQESRSRAEAAVTARDAATEACERQAAAIAAAEERRRLARAALASLEQQLDEARAGLDRLNRARAECLSEQGSARQRSGFLQAQAESLDGQARRLQQRQAELLVELERTGSVPAASAEPEEDLGAIEQEAEALRAALAQARASLAEAQDGRAQQTRARARIEQDLRALRERAARDEQARLAAERERAAEETRLADARAGLEGVEAELGEKQRQLAVLESALAEVRGERSRLGSELSRTRELEQKARAELELARAVARDLGLESGRAAESRREPHAPRLGARLRVPQELEQAVAAALGEWAFALERDSALQALQEPGPSAGRELFTTPSGPGASDDSGLQHFGALVAQQLGDLWHRLPAGRVEGADGADSLPGPLRYTVVVRDSEAAQRAAERLQATWSGPWQVATLAGDVITWHGGVARGVEREADRLISLTRRRAEATARLERAEAGAATAQTSQSDLQLRLAAVEARERQLSDSMVGGRAEIGLLERRAAELRGRCQRHQAALERRAPAAPTVDQRVQQDLLARLETLEQRAGELTALEARHTAAVRELEARWQAAWTRHQGAARETERRASEAEAALAARAQRRREFERLRAEREEVVARSADDRRELEELSGRIASLERQGAELEARLRAAAERADGIQANRQAAQASLDAADADESALQTELSRVRGERERLLLAAQQALDEVARLEAEMQATSEEWGLDGEAVVQLGLLGGERVAPAAVPAGEASPPIIDLAAARRRLLALQRELRAQGAVSESVLEEYREVEGRSQFLRTQSQDLRAALEELEGVISELESLMRGGFEAAFERVNAAFAETFETLFGGGTARLVLTDPSDTLTTGVEIVAQPPGKRLQNLMSLSGGERALTATALIFALLAINPLPFCVLDEVDAALDESNARRFSALLRRYSEHTQFILITHNRATMETARSLYGVSMSGDGVTTVLSLRLGEALAYSRNGHAARGSESLLQT